MDATLITLPCFRLRIIGRTSCMKSTTCITLSASTSWTQDTV